MAMTEGSDRCCSVTLIWVSRLRVHREAIKAFKDRGWTAELDCFTATSEVLDLTNDDLQEIAMLGLGLSLTMSYVTPDV